MGFDIKLAIYYFCLYAGVAHHAFEGSFTFENLLDLYLKEE